MADEQPPPEQGSGTGIPVNYERVAQKLAHELGQARAQIAMLEDAAETMATQLIRLGHKPGVAAPDSGEGSPS